METMEMATAPPAPERSVSGSGAARRALGYSKGGSAALILCNVGGMVDFVVLPLWVGSLMQSRGLSAQQAGLLVTAYILSVFVGSLTVSPRLDRLNARRMATIGFLTGMAGFLGLTLVEGLAPMVILHVVAGVGAGWGLSMTHGAMGRSLNPHRLFGLGNLGVAMFAIVFFSTVPPYLALHGIKALFLVLGGLLGLAGLGAALLFPRDRLTRAARAAAHGMTGAGEAETAPTAPVPLAVRVLPFIGVACLTTTQSMLFGFIERIGVSHGFDAGHISMMLVISGFANLTAPMIAAALERRLPHLGVSVCVLPLHALCGAAAVLAGGFLVYAGFTIAMVWLVIFGHIFIFALIADLDPSGRTSASTPAMIMIGSAIGPILGGTLASQFGYASLALAASLVGVLGSACFLSIIRFRSTTTLPAKDPVQC